MNHRIPAIVKSINSDFVFFAGHVGVPFVNPIVPEAQNCPQISLTMVNGAIPGLMVLPRDVCPSLGVSSPNLARASALAFFGGRA